MRNYLTGARRKSAKSSPEKYKRTARRFVLLSLVVVFGIHPLFGDKAIRKNDPHKKGAEGGMLSLSADPATNSPEQMTQELLFFMNRYHSFAGTQAVLDNIKDIDRLGKFLREYKVINAQTQADAHFLQSLQMKIYEDLADRLRSYGKAAEAAAVQRKRLEAAPSDRTLQADLAALLGQSPEGYAEALAIYRQLLKNNPADFDARLGLARLQVLKKDLPDALQNYEVLLKERPYDFAIKLDYARLLLLLKRPTEALQYLNTIADASPEFYSARLELARVAVQLGDLAKADEHLTVVMNSPKVTLELKKGVYAIYRDLVALREDLSLRRRYAMLFSQDKRTFAWSIAEYQAIINSGRAERDDYLGLARVLSWSQQYESSVKVYRDLLKSDPDARSILVELVAVLRWAGWFDEALGVADRLLALQPSSLDYKLEKARVLTEAKKYDEGFRLYQEVIAARPSQTSARLEYARALQTSGRSDRACKEYYELLPLALDPQVQLEYARVLGSLRRYAESDRVYQQLIAEKPDDHVLRLEYAQTLAWRNDINAAQQNFSEGTKSILDARRTFAKFLFWNGKYEESRAECLSLLNLQPNDRALQFDAARALVRLEQFEEALNELEQLRAEYPADKEIAAEYAQAVFLKERKAKNLEKPDTTANEAEPDPMPLGAKATSKKSGAQLRPIIIAPIKPDTKLSKKDLEQLAQNKALLGVETENDRLRLEVANQMLWTKKYREAIRMYREILAEDPSELDAHLGLAEASMELEDYTTAYRVFNYALTQDPTSVRAHYGLAQIYAYGGKIQDSRHALRELNQLFAVSFTHLQAYETDADLAREVSRTLTPFSQSHIDSDRYARFTVGTDYRYPVDDRTMLIGNYRYDVLRQDVPRRLYDDSYANWFGQHLTGRTYEFGIKRQISSNLQAQVSVGGTNFNWARSYMNAAASVEVSPHRNHLFSLGYEREPGIFFLNTVMALGAGLYGHRLQFAHSYRFLPKWEFSDSYQYTRLTSNHRYDAPDNTIQQAGASLHYRLLRDLSVGAAYSFVAFRARSPFYYSPHGDHSMSGEIAYQKSNKVIGFGLSASAGKLFQGRSNGYFLAAKSDLTFHPSRSLQMDLSYQPLYSSAGSVFGFHLYRYHMFLLNIKYWLDSPGDRVHRITG